MVAKGFNQIPGIDFHETFSPVVKAPTIRIILALAVANDWPVHQLDINNAFLYGHLEEDVFMVQPEGFVDAKCPDFVCKLDKALYGLRQAPRAWFDRLRSTLLEWGFSNSRADSSVFFFSNSCMVILVLIYVDDILITGDCFAFIDQFITRLAAKLLSWS